VTASSGQHPRTFAASAPDKIAVVLPTRSESRTYAELEARANQVAQLLVRRGLSVGDHVALLMSNSAEWFDVVWGCLRLGLFVTPINVHLLATEAAYILEDSGARALFASADLAETIAGLGSAVQDVPLRLAVGGELPGFELFEAALSDQPISPAPTEQEGAWMFYSSGTTGKPKGITPALPNPQLGSMSPFLALLGGLYGLDEGTVYLSPAPLYHAAPAGWCTAAQRLGGTVVAMERFDPLELLRLIEQHRVTHLQVVPTHLIRLLKLSPEVRAGFDLSSLRMLVHSAAPCPVETKRAALAWLGPIVHEFYSGSEGTGFFAIGPEEWLAHPGSVGRSLMGSVHVLDDEGQELPAGEEGQIWFESAHTFTYHRDAERTAGAFNDRGWSTIDDVGRLDDEGYLYLTDRASNMIISGGVNVYPREAEDLLVGHPSVGDVAVVGLPDPEMGERVTAFVQLAPGVAGSDELAAELVAYLRERLSSFKCPREVRFVDDLPRLPNGKLLKRLLTQP
jgi:long-chain acyl-CoA synthetase